MKRPGITVLLLTVSCFAIASEQDVFYGQGLQVVKPNGWRYITPADTHEMHKITKEEFISLKDLKLPVPLVGIENPTMDSAPLISIQATSRIPYTEDPKETLHWIINHLQALAMNVTVLEAPSDLSIDRRTAAHATLAISTEGTEVISSRVEVWVIPCSYNYLISANMAIDASTEERNVVNKIVESVELANWACP